MDLPDQMVLDLDPQGEDFEPVRSTAQAFKELLDDLELPAYLKTTGSRGLHIVVPLQRREGFDAVRDFARDLARIVVSRAPGERTRPGAPVSLPLDWSELRKKNLRSDGVTIRTIFDRLDQAGDPWAGFWRSAVSLSRARGKLGGYTKRAPADTA